MIILVAREGWSALHTGRDTARISVLGVVGMSATPSLIFGGLMFTRPEIAAIIVATQPLITVIAQRLMKGKNPDVFSVFCVMVAFVGVVTVVTRWETGFRLDSTELVGNLMILLGAGCWVAYTLSLDRYRHWSSLRLSAITMTVGAVSNTLLVVFLVAIGLLATPSAADWYDERWGLLFLALVGVLGAMVGWNVGSRRVGALNAILFINLIPVVTFLVRYWQGYSFKSIEIAGALLVMGALLAQNLWARTRVTAGLPKETHAPGSPQTRQ